MDRFNKPSKVADALDMNTSAFVEVATSNLPTGRLARQFGLTVSIVEAIRNGTLSEDDCRFEVPSIHRQVSRAQQRQRTGQSSMVVL